MSQPENLTATVCIAATRDDCVADGWMRHILQTLSEPTQVSVWTLDDGEPGREPFLFPSAVAKIDAPPHDALLILPSPAAAIEAILAGVDLERALLWSTCKDFLIDLSPEIRAITLRHFRRSLAVCAISTSDAEAWRALIGRSPEVIDLRTIERRVISSAEPLIERGADPRLFVAFPDDQYIDQRLIDVYVALEGRRCELWHLSPAELKPWMRPDMQFSAIPYAERGLYLRSVDAGTVDESRPEAEERICDYLAAGAVPIPIGNSDLCRPALDALGLGDIAKAGTFDARVELWLLRAASRTGLREATLAYAMRAGFVALAEPSLPERLTRALAAQRGYLSDAGTPIDDVASDTALLRRSMAARRRWEEPSCYMSLVAGKRLLITVSGRIREEVRGGSCDILVVGPTGSARVTSTLTPQSSLEQGYEDSFHGSCLVPEAVDKAERVDLALSDIVFLGVDKITGSAAVLQRSTEGPTAADAATKRRSDSVASQNSDYETRIIGRILHLAAEPVCAVTVPAHLIAPGSSSVRLVDSAGDAVCGSTWLSLEGGNCTFTVALPPIDADGLRNIDAWSHSLGQLGRLTFWCDDTAIAAAFIYRS